MAVGGDIIELVHEQYYLGQQVNNVYFFEGAVASPSMASLATWFETNVVTAIKSVQNTDVQHLNLRLRNLFNLAETLEEPLTGTGAETSGTGELPAFMAYTIRFDHGVATIRSGFKRWAGVLEGYLDDSLVNASMVSQLNVIGGELINPPTTPNTDWAHVIVKRICETPNPDPEGVPSCLKYRLPQNQGEAVVGYPTSFEVYTQPTTQNSRKWYT